MRCPLQPPDHVLTLEGEVRSMTPYCWARTAYIWQHRSPKRSRSCGGQTLPLGRDPGIKSPRSPRGSACLSGSIYSAPAPGCCRRLSCLCVDYNLRPHPVLSAEGGRLTRPNTPAVAPATCRGGAFPLLDNNHSQMPGGKCLAHRAEKHKGWHKVQTRGLLTPLSSKQKD